MSENQKDIRVPAFVYCPISKRTRSAFRQVQNTLKNDVEEAPNKLLKPIQIKSRTSSLSELKSEIENNIAINKLRLEKNITIRRGRDLSTSPCLEVKARHCKVTKENLAPAKIKQNKSESCTSSISVVPKKTNENSSQRSMLVVKRRSKSLSDATSLENNLARKTKKEVPQKIRVRKRL